MPLRPALLAGYALAALAAPLAAQEVPAIVPAADAGPVSDVLKPGDIIDFAADELAYADDDEVVTASGNVQVRRDGYKLIADTVVYNRKSGVVEARGNVIITDPDGVQAFGDRIELTESLKDGVVDNILVVLTDGGRLAATSATRANGVSTLNRAVYSPCSVEDAQGCGREPLWQIKAVRIIHDPNRQRIFYRQGRLEFLGLPIIYLPSMSHPDGGAERSSGVLLPDIEVRRTLGFGFNVPYNLVFGPHSDLTIAPWIYSGANPALSLDYRRLFGAGPVRATAFMTYANRSDFSDDGTTVIDRGDKFRGYFTANGRFQHSPRLRTTFSLRRATDDTFARRYDLNDDDSLRSVIELERFGRTSYFSVSGWAFQGLRVTDRSGETPIALPLIDFDWRPDLAVLGGRLQVAVNTLAITRTDGQDMQRALASVRWDRSLYTVLGQRFTATALLRGDVYHASDVERATLPIYAGKENVQARAIPVAALDLEWPFAGPAWGGVQTITPRVQLVASGSGENEDIPNEDSRAIDLDDVNLFSLNRFPGYDRWEGDMRLTYGLDYTLERARWQLRAQIGQSYRLDGKPGLFPEGVGLTDRTSDVVGRTTLKYGRLVELTHRYRLDKDSSRFRRNEIDLAVGTSRTYATLGYAKLTRGFTLEELEDREEVRVGGRVAFAKYWSIFGSAIVDLTSRRESPLTGADGFEPVRHRIGAQYEDECFRFGLSWRRDYVGDRDFRAGSTYLLTLAFKNLGR